MATNAASSSVLSQRMRSRLQVWRQSILPAFMKKRKNFIVRKGAFESVLGGYGPSQYLPGRNFEAGPPWYRGDEDLPIILTDRVKRFYQEYCGLESPQLEARLCETRRQAWSLGDYPTFGNWSFARDTLRAHPFYSELVSKLKAGATLLEVGPGIGQDLRYLAYDGAPTDRMLAIDWCLDLWKLGLTLFNDGGFIKQQDGVPLNHGRDDFRVRFIEADLQSHRTLTDPFKALHGTYDIIMANNFFNNAVDWTSSKWALQTLEPFTKVGTIFLGYHFAPAKQAIYTADDMYYFDQVELQMNVFDKASGGPENHAIQWVTDSYTTVDLKEWGLEEKHWSWIRSLGLPDQVQVMRGAYYVMRRIR